MCVVDGLSRDLTTAYLTRVTRAGADGTRESALLARSLTGATPMESTLVDRASVSYAVQGPHDGALLVVDADASGTGGVHRLLRPGAADVRIDLPREAERPALWTPVPPRSP